MFEYQHAETEQPDITNLRDQNEGRFLTLETSYTKKKPNIPAIVLRLQPNN